MSPVKLPPSDSSSNSNSNSDGGSEPIHWPDGLGPVGGLLTAAGKDFEKLRQGLISAFNLPYTPGVDPDSDPDDDVTKPFLKFFLDSKESSEQLIQMIGRGLGIRGDSTLTTDARHLDADELNTSISKIFHK